jgi:hypothetical protein
MKYLIYIDILGFSKMVAENSNKIDWLYKTINELNVHEHHAFKVIIFSDTILAYSDFECTSPEDHMYASMYAIEFTQDLFYKITKEGLFFRAVIDYGKFTHEKLSRCDKFFGNALINCYNLEKNINCIGTFITTKASKYQNIFPMLPFSKELYFVYFQQHYYQFSEKYNHTDCKHWHILNFNEGPNWIAQETYLFKIIHRQARENLEPRVREKFIQYLEYYRIKYPWPLNIWEKNGFGMNQIIPSDQWRQVYRKIINENY